MPAYFAIRWAYGFGFGVGFGTSFCIGFGCGVDIWMCGVLALLTFQLLDAALMFGVDFGTSFCIGFGCGVWLVAMCLMLE